LNKDLLKVKSPPPFKVRTKSKAKLPMIKMPNENEKEKDVVAERYEPVKVQIVSEKNSKNEFD
jgi:hypothetical protein